MEEIGRSKMAEGGKAAKDERFIKNDNPLPTHNTQNDTAKAAQASVAERKLIWSGRSLHLSSMGSGDIASKAMTATTVQSDSTSARTDQLRDEKSSPKQPLETLADQTSADTVAENRESMKSSCTPR